MHRFIGKFDYGLLDCTTSKFQQYIEKNKWIYIGEMKEGTNIPNGIGIKVRSNGAIQEGYWKDDQQHGKARYIGKLAIKIYDSLMFRFTFSFT